METERMDGEERERIGEYFVYSIRFISMDIFLNPLKWLIVNCL